MCNLACDVSNYFSNKQIYTNNIPTTKQKIIININIKNKGHMYFHVNFAVTGNSNCFSVHWMFSTARRAPSNKPIRRIKTTIPTKPEAISAIDRILGSLSASLDKVIPTIPRYANGNCQN